MEKIALLLLLIAIGICAAVNNTCTSVGKFIADVNCTSYVVCSKIDTQITSYTIQCPPGFMVRHTDMVCSMTGTQCESSFACTSVGNFTNPASMNASAYISCIQGIGDLIIATVMECPAPMEFNATLGGCELKSVLATAQSVTTSQGATAVAGVTVAMGVVTTEGAKEIIQPSVATVIQTAGSKNPNSSSFVLPSYNVILFTVSALLLLYDVK